MCGCIRHPRLHDCSLWAPRSRPWSIDVTEHLSGTCSGNAWKQIGRRVLSFKVSHSVWSELQDSELFLGGPGGLAGTSAARIRRCNLAEVLSRISNNEAASSKKCRFRRPGNDGNLSSQVAATVRGVHRKPW